MKISVIGLGYVGAVSAACIGSGEHTVIGVDSNADKVNLINEGKSPIIEKDLDELLKSAIDSGKLKAQTNIDSAILETDVSIICVGTPSQLNGNLDLRFVRKVCEEIGSAIARHPGFHTVVIRSTMLPGTMENVVIPILEESSGKKPGKDFGICINPEFLREGSAIFDYYNPPKIVIGEIDDKSGNVLVEIYKNITAPLVRVSINTAEMVKYTDNVWHALKVGFANEIGNICKKLNIDGQEVMQIFCKDSKLNLSSYYLRPGFAFGGSCLPKDLRALNYKAKAIDVDVPILNSILISNKVHIENGINLIMSKNTKNVGILGFSFKAGTDDLRESPLIEVIQTLIGKGYNLKLYDKNVNLSALVGANKDYLMNHIPHISRLMVNSVDEVLAQSETIVVGNNSDEFKVALKNAKPGHHIIDLSGLRDMDVGDGVYEGICW